MTEDEAVRGLPTCPATYLLRDGAPVCTTCGAAVGGTDADQIRHSAWHTALAACLPRATRTAPPCNAGDDVAIRTYPDGGIVPSRPRRRPPPNRSRPKARSATHQPLQAQPPRRPSNAMIPRSLARCARARMNKHTGQSSPVS